ncbi:MAG: helix-turn-helix domain-containing protein [Nocardioidaceae bacterium]
MSGSGGVGKLLGVKEAATLAHRSPETIRRWVWSGRLSARREGNRLLVTRDDVLRLAGLEPQSGASDPPSLVQWALDTRDHLRQGGDGATASDLVLHGRHERSDAGR